MHWKFEISFFLRFSSFGEVDLGPFYFGVSFWGGNMGMAHNLHCNAKKQ